MRIRSLASLLRVLLRVRVFNMCARGCLCVDAPNVRVFMRAHAPYRGLLVALRRSGRVVLVSRVGFQLTRVRQVLALTKSCPRSGTPGTWPRCRAMRHADIVDCLMAGIRFFFTCDTWPCIKVPCAVWSQNGGCRAPPFSTSNSFVLRKRNSATDQKDVGVLSFLVTVDVAVLWLCCQLARIRGQAFMSPRCGQGSR